MTKPKTKLTLMAVAMLVAMTATSGAHAGKKAVMDQVLGVERVQAVNPAEVAAASALDDARLEEAFTAKSDPLMSNFTGDPVGKFKTILDKAELGDPEAQMLAGWAYQHGVGVQQNYKAAGFWYEQASDRKNATGSLLLAKLHEDKRMWLVFEKAKQEECTRRIANPKTNAAEFFLETTGKNITAGLCSHDEKQAAAPWYEKAADQGDISAMLWMGWFYGKAANLNRYTSYNELSLTRKMYAMGGQAYGLSMRDAAWVAQKYMRRAAKLDSAVAKKWLEDHRSLQWDERENSQGSQNCLFGLQATCQRPHPPGYDTEE